MNKKLFKGIFNYAGHNFILYSHSTSKEKVFLNFINQIARRTKVGKRTIMFAFNGSKDNYLIQEVKKDDN